MNILEVCSGTESFTKEARAKGHTVFTVDINPKFHPSLVKDILALVPQDIPFIPDVLWLSPPCTEYSHAKRRGKRNIRFANKLVRRCLWLIEEFRKLNPKLIWILENPQTGLLKDQPFMKGLPFNDVSYCKYGYPYRKQTRFWNNFQDWTPRPLCHKDCGFIKKGKHILSAGNGRKKYTSYSVPLIQKYSVPPTLCQEMVIKCEEIMARP